MPEMDYKIDIYNLENELAYQPHNHKIVSDVYADTIYERDSRKAALERKKAEIFLDVQKNPANYGITKATGAIADACVETNKEVLKAQEDLFEAVRSMNKAISNKEASEHKKKALESEVKLYLSNYFVEPYVGDAEKSALTDRKGEDVKTQINRNLKKKGTPRNE